MGEVVFIVVFFAVVAFCTCAFIKGAFPAFGAGMTRNYLVFGDKNVNPRLLTGSRARGLAFLMGTLFLLFSVSLFSPNTFMNMIGILLGFLIGVPLYFWSYKQASR